MKPIFSHVGETVNFSQAPQRPPQTLQLLQAEVESAGGIRFVSDPVSGETTLALHWPRLALADLQQLQIFFDAVDGMAELFSYTDTFGAARSVRFAQPELSWAEIAFERYAVTVQLLEE